MRRCPPKDREPMHSGELISRLHEIGDAIENRAQSLSNMFGGSGQTHIGVKALRDDALLLHVLGDQLAELSEADQAFLAVLMAAVGPEYENRRRP